MTVALSILARSNFFEAENGRKKRFVPSASAADTQAKKTQRGIKESAKNIAKNSKEKEKEGELLERRKKRRKKGNLEHKGKKSKTEKVERVRN